MRQTSDRRQACGANHHGGGGLGQGCHYSPEDISRPAFFYNAYAGKAFSSTAYGGDYLAVCKGGAAFPSPPPQ